jgi:iron complex outermembrane recepter protein
MKNKTKSVPRTPRKRARLSIYGSCFAGASLLFNASAAEAPKTNDVTSVTKSSRATKSAEIDPDELFKKDLAEIMQFNIKVSSPSKKPEKLSDAAASIFVITDEDIRRSGVTSIPEALRLSPGVEVARQDSHTWAISSRGFNDEFANQLLVLIDGRSVYTPLFAGVYWDVQDLMLEDIQRIEVIRGPGATLWGANAVNGVINITTKSAKDTQGVLLSGGGGTEEVGFGARYGAELHKDGYLRVYGKWFNRDESVVPNDGEANDAWTMYRGGFRYDYLPEKNPNAFTLQGDIYSGTLDQRVTEAMLPPTYVRQNDDDVDVSGADILGKWVHTFSAFSELALKVYYDRTWRDRVVFAETRNTFDIDLQHRMKIGDRNDVVWGLGYNMTSDDLGNTFMVSFDPAKRTTHLYSGFVQDEISIIEDKLRLTLGTKLEHNDYTGWEVQPSARLSFNVTTNQTLWLSASRAISTPSRAENNIRINRGVFPPTHPQNPVPGADTVISLLGSESMESKELIGFELGYRVQPLERFNVDIATFYNIYDKQRSISGPSGAGPGGTDPNPYPGTVTLPFSIGNNIDGETYGFEVASNFKATDWWRIRANYSFLKVNLHLDNGANDPVVLEGAEHDSPVHQIGIRTMMDLHTALGIKDSYAIELDGGMRYVDSLSNRGVPSYIVGDVRLGWRSKPVNGVSHWEVSITGQNLFDTHKEFAPSYIPTQVTEVETSVFAKVTFRY